MAAARISHKALALTCRVFDRTAYLSSRRCVSHFTFKPNDPDPNLGSHIYC